MTKTGSAKLKSTVIHHAVRRKYGLTVDEYCLADSICRLSSGPEWPWCKKEKDDLGSDLDMSGRTVYRKLEKLVKKGLVIMSIEGLRATDEWRDNAEFDTVSKKKDKTAKEIDTLSSPSIYKDSTKDSTKLSAASGGEVNEIIGLFRSVNPSYSMFYARKPQRAAVERLLKLYPRPKLDQIIAILPKTNAEKYAPAIHSPIELEAKIGKLEAFIQRGPDKKGKNIIGL